MSDRELLELAREHIAQAFALVGQVGRIDADDQENLSYAQSRMASAARYLSRVER